jgi:hypothetical protein
MAEERGISLGCCYYDPRDIDNSWELSGSKDLESPSWSWEYN